MPFYHSKIKCCIAVQQAYRALGRLPQVEFEQLTERNSSKRNGGCLAQGANITPLWTVWSSLCPNLISFFSILFASFQFSVFGLHISHPKTCLLDLPPLLQHPGTQASDPAHTDSLHPSRCTLTLRPVQAATLILGPHEPAACTLPQS